MTSCLQEFAWFSFKSPMNHKTTVMDNRRGLKNVKTQLNTCSLSKMQPLLEVRQSKVCEDKNPSFLHKR